MRYFLVSILFLCMENTIAQMDSIPLKMEYYASFKNTDLLFVHTDKHIYTNNEFIWFSAWLLRCGNDSLPLHRVLSLALVPADTRIVRVQQKFVMTNGYSYGSIQLPDSIAPGECKLLAYTNMMGADSLPVALFTQDVSIRSLRQSDFVAAATILEDTTASKDLLITVRDKVTGKPVQNAELSLWSGNSKTITASTGKNGMYRQNLSALKPININSPMVITKIKYQGDVEYLQHKWPWTTSAPQLEMRFYPEGGYLVSNLPGNIGWESKSDQGEPVAISAVVFEDQRPIDTIKTNEKGLGNFKIVPHAGATYSIRPLAWPNGMKLKEEGYTLQTTLSKGMTISVPQAITGDSLWFNVYATGYSQVTMVVHNFQTVFNQQILPGKEGGVRVLLLLDDVPKGLTAITLLDSNGGPLAERIFFAHYNRRAKCAITPDKKVYEKRQQVKVTFQLTNNQQPIAGFASVACAQANRFDNSKHQDIESFAYLHAAIQDAPAFSTGQGYNDVEYLENVLLVRGWRRYAWQELLADNHQPPMYHTPFISGKVIPGLGKIKKPLTVTILNGNTSVSFVSTDSMGNFTCAYDQLLVEQDKRLWMNAGDKTLDNKLVLHDPFIDINKRLAVKMHFNSVDADRYLQYALDLAESDFQKVKQLTLVTVTAKKSKDESMFGATNACGDYICMGNRLNCYTHAGQSSNRLPEKGKTYFTNGGGTAVYWGCAFEENNHGVFQYDGIKLGKEFYKIDPDEMTTGNPQNISTLYWLPTLVFDKDGKGEINFYTGDITGRFRIVVNGLAGDKLFYANGFIDVK
ncbi:hypothetical protein FAM09_19090 [Niastella caeni]|uniref:Carboxypeptidase regulatory-like domain-containing protein n=1 Tax=Niastella caeni TaxID=2569763 RepID=A0A4S8HNU3_9BACT|nr:hypothetical protein [Niastella caeni]THU37060.1 hypothetical protein FAM09_19090 [Niastella caeni]